MNAKIQGKVVNDLANEVLRRWLGNQDFLAPLFWERCECRSYMWVGACNAGIGACNRDSGVTMVILDLRVGWPAPPGQAENISAQLTVTLTSERQ